MRFMGQIRHRAHALGISLLLVGVPSVRAADLAARIIFDIPAQPLSTAILRYSEQSGVQVTSPSELLSGRRTRGVSGAQSAQTALVQLLEGTGLVFAMINRGTVAIHKAPQSSRGTGATVPGKARDGPQATHEREPADLSQATNSAERAGSPTSLSGRVTPAPQEVIVSARKQSETLLDVPESITAYSARTLTEYNIQSFIDYATLTPNLSFSYGTGQLGFVTSRSVAIRGISGPGTTALYIDDIPVPESIDPRVVDIERIEILRGPQGTLYGQSSLGGNVRLVTVEPSFTAADAHVATQLGWTSGGASPDYSSDFAGTLTLIPERVAVRAVMFVDHDAGFLTRSFFTDNGAGESSDDNQGAVLTYGGSVSILNRITDELDVSLRIMYQDQSDHGWPASWAQLPQFVPASYIVNRVADVQEVATDNWYLPSLQISYRGSGWSLSSSTNYFSRKAHDIEDGTEGTDDVLSILDGLKLDPYSPIPWDGYYMDHRLVHETRVSIVKLHRISGVVGVYLSKVIDNGILNSHDIPGIAAAGLWPTNLGWYSQNENEIRSTALFGELYYDVEDFELTLGLRRYALRQNGLVYAAGALNGQLTDQTLEQTSQQGVSPKLALSYKLTPDTMVYGLASNGFRPGGAGRVLPPICEPFPTGSDLQTNQPTSYGSDSVWNYEVGAKSELLSQHLLLTGSVFQMNWTDIQQTVTLPNCFITFIANAGAARARGAELELSGQPWQRLDLRAGVGFDNAIITDEGFSQQPVGSRVYQIPRWTWMSGATYTQPLGTQHSGFLTLDLAHVGDSVSGTSGIGTGLTRPAYTILNSRLGIRWSNNELALYANNIANERANLGDLNPISYDPIDASGSRMLRIAVLRPFQIGMQFRHAF